MMDRNSSLAVRRMGRPRKFSRPSTAVTLTIPDDVIATLKSIDADLSRAIVRLVQPLVGRSVPSTASKLTTIGDRASLILLAPSRSLSEQTGVELLPTSDGRVLLSFSESVSVAEFELRLRDALANSALDENDRAMFSELAEILRQARNANGEVLQERRIVVLRRLGIGA